MFFDQEYHDYYHKTLLLLVHRLENVFKTICFDPPTLLVGKDLVIYWTKEQKDILKLIERETIPSVRAAWIDYLLEKTKHSKCKKSD